ncbi:hypothetical protein EVA_09020 [gut metagenome]|uniref:Uncharacterized protein n=1 Tax=gut metagenome TaxID=749906 RepID=J9GL30_9ZZZZ
MINTPEPKRWGELLTFFSKHIPQEVRVERIEELRRNSIKNERTSDFISRYLMRYRRMICKEEVMYSCTV